MKDIKEDKLEKFLQENILVDLKNGRLNFDEPHTKAVVYWLKKILKNNPELNLDYEVLLISAYAHDWGYVGLFKKSQQVQLKEIGKMKKEHMIVGAKKLEKLLENVFFNFLSKKQKERCVHLVAQHDKLEELKDIDELVLMEADTLGGLDISKIKTTFNKESEKRYLKKTKKNRITKFITAFGKTKAELLWEERKKLAR